MEEDSRLTDGKDWSRCVELAIESLQVLEGSGGEEGQGGGLERLAAAAAEAVGAGAGAGAGEAQGGEVAAEGGGEGGGEAGVAGVVAAAAAAGGAGGGGGGGGGGEAAAGRGRGGLRAAHEGLSPTAQTLGVVIKFGFEQVQRMVKLLRQHRKSNVTLARHGNASAAALLPPPLPPPSPPPACPRAELEQGLERLCATLLSLQEERENHFGCCRKEVYLNEITLLQARMWKLIQQARQEGGGAVGAGQHDERVSPTTRRATAGSHQTAFSCSCYIASLWWRASFGESTTRVSWTAFRAAFIEQFGSQLDDPMQRLQDVLCSPPRDEADGETPGGRQVSRGASRSMGGASVSSASSVRARSSTTVRRRRAGGGSSSSSSRSCTGRAEGEGEQQFASQHNLHRLAPLQQQQQQQQEEEEEPTLNNSGGSGGGRGGGSGGSIGGVAASGDDNILPMDHGSDGGGGGSAEEEDEGSDCEDAKGGASGAVGDTCTGGYHVHARAFDAFTTEYGGGQGVYEAYQALTDPKRVVYEFGVVEDDADRFFSRPSVVLGCLGLNITQISCGGQHAAVLTEAGDIYTWGRGGLGRLGHGDSVQVERARRVEALRGVPCQQVVCGFAYSTAVSRDGELYTWGAGENGRLGLGDTEDRLVPCKVDSLHPRVSRVYAGSVHTCVAMREGTVFSFGRCEYTGHGESTDLLTPKELEEFRSMPVKAISVGPGGYHTMALTCSGSVFTWGHNRVGQLGFPNSLGVPKNVEGAHFVPRPTKVEDLEGLGVSKIVAGWGHSSVLTGAGTVLVCGRNHRGQLGLGEPAVGFPKNERGHSFQATFREVKTLKDVQVVDIACGGEHTVAVTTTGDVYSFGMNHKGQLGHGGTGDEHFPRLVRSLKESRRVVECVCCGNNCTLVLARPPAFATLFERCLTLIRRMPEVFSGIDTVGMCIPQALADELHSNDRRTEEASSRRAAAVASSKRLHP